VLVKQCTPGEVHHPGLGLGLGLRFRVTVRVRVRVGLGLGIGIGLGTGVVIFAGSAVSNSAGPYRGGIWGYRIQNIINAVASRPTAGQLVRGLADRLSVG